MGCHWGEFKAEPGVRAEVLIAARAPETGLEVLRPALQTGDVENRGTVAGTVKRDQHDIGKNLVKMKMEGRG